MLEAQCATHTQYVRRRPRTPSPPAAPSPPLPPPPTDFTASRHEPQGSLVGAESSEVVGFESVRAETDGGEGASAAQCVLGSSICPACSPRLHNRTVAAVQQVLGTWVSWQQHARQEGGSVYLEHLESKMCALVKETLRQTVPFSAHPKVFVYTANATTGGWPLYLQTLQALGWDHYLLGYEVAATHPGAYMRLRALRLLLCALHPEQQVVVTDGADVLALRGPSHFTRAHSRLRV